jgi:hypothetical protein
MLPFLGILSEAEEVYTVSRMAARDEGPGISHEDDDWSPSYPFSVILLFNFISSYCSKTLALKATELVCW